jgi:hypothetical protein
VRIKIHVNLFTGPFTYWTQQRERSKGEEVRGRKKEKMELIGPELLDLLAENTS